MNYRRILLNMSNNNVLNIGSFLYCFEHHFVMRNLLYKD